MFQFIGIFVTWLFGAWLSFMLPVLFGLYRSNSTENLGTTIKCFWFGAVFLLVYVGTTMAYFIVN